MSIRHKAGPFFDQREEIHIDPSAMKKITLILSILIGYLLSTVPCHAYRDLETGVFLTRDPAGFVDGPNVYTYVSQNPWTKFDPEGLRPENVGDNFDASGKRTSLMRMDPAFQKAYYKASDRAIVTGAALTVGVAATVATGGAAAAAFSGLELSGPTIGVTAAAISGAAGGYAGNATSNVLAGKPVNEGGTKAAIYGAAAGAAFQTAANIGKAFMEGLRTGAASARAIQVARAEAAKTTKEIRTRPTKGADGGTSEHIIERDASGEVISKTHRVETDGEVVHQHQDHQGKYGGERRFPDEWVEHPEVNAPPHVPRPAKDNSIKD